MQSREFSCKEKREALCHRMQAHKGPLHLSARTKLVWAVAQSHGSGAWQVSGACAVTLVHGELPAQPLPVCRWGH